MLRVTWSLTEVRFNVNTDFPGTAIPITKIVGPSHNYNVRPCTDETTRSQWKATISTGPCRFHTSPTLSPQIWTYTCSKNRAVLDSCNLGSLPIDTTTGPFSSRYWYMAVSLYTYTSELKCFYFIFLLSDVLAALCMCIKEMPNCWYTSVKPREDNAEGFGKFANLPNKF